MSLLRIINIYFAAFRQIKCSIYPLCPQQYLYKLDLGLNVLDSLDINVLLGLDSTEYFYLSDIQISGHGFIYALGNIQRQTTSCEDRTSLIIKLNQALMPLDTFYLRNDSIEFIYVDMDLQNSMVNVTGTGIQCGKTTYKFV